MSVWLFVTTAVAELVSPGGIGTGTGYAPRRWVEHQCFDNNTHMHGRCNVFITLLSEFLSTATLHLKITYSLDSGPECSYYTPTPNIHNIIHITRLYRTPIFTHPLYTSTLHLLELDIRIREGSPGRQRLSDVRQNLPAINKKKKKQVSRGQNLRTVLVFQPNWRNLFLLPSCTWGQPISQQHRTKKVPPPLPPPSPPDAS